jgi:hypothetical protein
MLRRPTTFLRFGFEHVASTTDDPAADPLLRGAGGVVGAVIELLDERPPTVEHVATDDVRPPRRRLVSPFGHLQSVRRIPE